jgi:hypothetical protein
MVAAAAAGAQAKDQPIAELVQKTTLKKVLLGDQKVIGWLADASSLCRYVASPMRCLVTLWSSRGSSCVCASVHALLCMPG